MKLLVQLALLGSLCAQPQAPQPQVRGTVTEPGSRQPVVDATVTVFLRPDPAPKVLLNGGFSDVYLETKTGNDGSFSFEVERYATVRVKVEKEGYRGSGSFMAATDESVFELDKGHPTRDLSLHLSRPGVITGRVVDEETRKPVAHVKLGASQAVFLSGRRRLLPSSAPVETGADGTFAVRDLAPAEYVIVIRPQAASEIGLLTRFTPSDFEAVDRDFERTWWPGGRDEDSAVPIPIGSGQTFDIGQIAVRKVSLYRAKATLSSASCVPGEKLAMSLVVASHGLVSNRMLKAGFCGQPFLSTGLEAGAYSLEAHSDGRPFEDMERGWVRLELKDKNIEVKSLLFRGVDVDVQMVAAEGSRPADWSGVRVNLRPQGRASNGSELPGMLSADGRLHLVNREAREHDLVLSELPQGFYVKEVRYNGAVTPVGTVTISGAAMAHKIEVVVEDKPASLAGEAPPGSRMVLARFPLPESNPMLGFSSAVAGEDGRYQFGSLAPGEYRIFAIGTDAIREMDRPGVLDGLLQAAKKVTLAAGVAQTVDLEK